MSESDNINRLRRRLVAGGPGLVAGAGMPAIIDYLAKTYGNEQPK